MQMPKTIAAEYAARWNQDIAKLYRPIRWLPMPKPWLYVTDNPKQPTVVNFFLLVSVNSSLLDCPDRYRRAIIAHECGHHRGLHTVISFGLMLMLWTVADKSPFWLGFAIDPVQHGVSAFCIFFVAAYTLPRILWPKAEELADDYAARTVGADDLVATLRWLSRKMPDGAGRSQVQNRIKRLVRLAKLTGNVD